MHLTEAMIDVGRRLDAVAAGQALYRIHSRYPADLGFARDLALRDSGYLLAAANHGAR